MQIVSPQPEQLHVPAYLDTLGIPTLNASLNVLLTRNVQETWPALVRSVKILVLDCVVYMLPVMFQTIFPFANVILGTLEMHLLHVKE